MSDNRRTFNEDEIEGEIRLAFERVGVEVLGIRSGTWYLRLPAMDDTVFQSSNLIKLLIEMSTRDEQQRRILTVITGIVTGKSPDQYRRWMSLPPNRRDK